MNLEKFVQILKDYFQDKNIVDRMSITYSRMDFQPDSFFIWMQKYLDELGISYFEFVYLEGEIIIKKYVYESILGDVGFYFPFEIALKDESKGFFPNNFKTIQVLVQKSL